MTIVPGRHRGSIRLKDFDYASGALYFLTICTSARRCIFGRIEDGESHFNKLGQIVEDEWLVSLSLRRYLDLDAYVIMPNHMHGIVAVRAQGGDVPSGVQGARSAPLRGQRMRQGMQAKSLASFVAGFKAAVTRAARQAFPHLRMPIWQRNYYEHVIRDERDLERIRDYIAANPARWEDDGYHPRFAAEAREGARSAPSRYALNDITAASVRRHRRGGPVGMVLAPRRNAPATSARSMGATAR